MADITGGEGGGDLHAIVEARLTISIPGYRLLNVIGRGGQATVYKATDPAGSPVAVKILHGGPFADERARLRLHRESVVLRALDHPNIVSYLDSGRSTNDHDFLVMNYIDGPTLDHFWRGKPSASCHSARRILLLQLFAKICDSIGAAHRAGITHRDLSPSNIRVDGHGEPHILDFGLARSAFDPYLQDASKAMSITGEFLGKLAYASPEQVRGESAEVDIRGDVYALGVILYQLLTGGYLPYDVESSAADAIHHILNTKPKPPTRLLRDKGELDDAIGDVGTDAIVLKALEKEPGRRYQSASELGRDIEKHLAGEPVIAQFGNFQRPRVGNRLLGTLIVCATIFGVVIAARLIPHQPSTVPEAIGSPGIADPVLLAGQRRIDLLSTVDLARDVVHGSWERKGSALICRMDQDNRIGFRYVPPPEYDFRIVFIAAENNAEVSSICLAAGHQFAWILGGWGNEISGFHLVDGREAIDSPFSKSAEKWIVGGKWHTSLVRVRRRSVEALLDGVSICKLETTYDNLRLPRMLSIHGEDTLGILSREADITIEKADVVEVSGVGQTRP